MQSGFTGHVTPVEWRWVFIVSILFVALAFFPFLWIVINSQPDSGWHFMGALHSHVEASAYLSRIRQGMEGDLLIQFLHTPEDHPSVIVQPIYALLGLVSRLAADNLSPVIVFHVARVSVTVFMYLALYQLAATIWMRVRTRRVFFVLVSVGSGFGWLVVAISGGSAIVNSPIDIAYSHLSPFYSGLVSIHIPMTIACLALLTAIIIAALRPGVDSIPSVKNSGIIAFGAGIVLVLLYPEAYVVLGIAFTITVGVQWYFAKKITNREVLWLMWAVVPALPILIYYVLIIRSNPFMVEWMQQRASQVIDPIQLLIGFGGILLIGLPSIVRAVRRFESDGDRYMLVWLLVASAGSLLPLDMRVHFLVGVMIPIAFFATRSIEDVWLKYVARRYRSILFAIIVPLLMISNLFVLLIPIIPLSSHNPTQSAGLVLSTSYRAALNWLDKQTSSNDVVMSSPEIGSWVPLWLGGHSVVGHPTETMNSVEKTSEVIDWYRKTSLEECDNSLIRMSGLNQRYSVNFVIYGPLEQRFGDGLCLRQFTFVASFGDVEIYRVPSAFPR